MMWEALFGKHEDNQLTRNQQVFGRTTNPHNKAYSPGGSTGGEAALIAFGGSRIGVGKITIPSIRAVSDKIHRHGCCWIGPNPCTLFGNLYHPLLKWPISSVRECHFHGRSRGCYGRLLAYGPLTARPRVLSPECGRNEAVDL